MDKNNEVIRTPIAKTIVREVVKPKEVIGQVISRNNYPVNLNYNKDVIRLSPKGKTKCDILFDKLGTLPKGTVFVQK